MTPSLSGIDGLRLLWYVALPLQLGGFVAPSRWFWPGLVRRRVPVATYKFLRNVRKKYGPRVRCWFPFNSTLLVLDGIGIDEVLQSTCNAADPRVKAWALTRFTPFGLLVSRGDEWSARRDFNTDVLATYGPSHPDASSFLSIIDDETGNLLPPERKVLAWDDFSELGARISQQIVFGRGNFRPDFDRHLCGLVSASNWFVRHPCHYARFNRRLEEGLGTSANAPPGSLACTARGKANPARAEGTATIQPVSQAAFWCFVLKDAVELHTVRTLALIASASSAFRERLMIEVGGVPHDPERFPAFAMPLLEGCIREQLRLWTPVPVLPRSVVQDFEFDGTPVRQGQQILLHPGFYHRDPEVFGPRADRFCPEQPPDSHGPPVVYSFSRHRQACAGEPLVMLVLKAVLVSLLRRGAVELVEHRIDTDAVPVAIDHFALRFQWRGNEGRVTPAKGA